MQKKLILYIIILFILSSAYLLAIGSKFETLDFGKNWWALYFADPKGDSLDFVIENHSDNTDFHWKVMVDKETVEEGSVADASLLEPRSRIRIIPETSTTSLLKNKKVTIEVSTGNEKKEIYKNRQ